MAADNSRGRLTTHVLDTSAGVPASKLVVELFRIENGSHVLLKSVQTNDDGRCDAPLLEGDAFTQGEYEIVFKVGGYFSNAGENPFLGDVPVRFGVDTADEHYHVPLLVSPFGYSTYRGS